jgi:hypothetical protein
MINIEEDFEVNDFNNAASLKIETTYYGDEADYIRDYKNTHSKEEIRGDYLNYYANDYRDIEVIKDAAFLDDEINNIITTKEEYLVKSFWKHDSTKNQNITDIYARSIANYLRVPETKIRAMPLRLTFPCEIHLNQNVKFSTNWDIESTQKKIEGKGFKYSSTVTCVRKTLRLKYNYTNKLPYLEPGDIKDYIQKIDEVHNDLNFKLSYADDNPKSEANQTVLFIIIIVVVCVIIFLKRKNYF